MEKSIIFAKTLKAVSDRGNSDVSLSQIAKSLGCKKQSLYSYFENKDELIDQSLKYASDTVVVPKVSINFNNDIEKIFIDLIDFYIKLFKEGIGRDFLSAIFVLSEYQRRDIISIDDIIYAFESQVFFVFNELADRERIAESEQFDYLSHLVALSILEIIVGWSDEKKGEYEKGKLIDFILTVLHKK